MPIEIERKFLVKGEYKPFSKGAVHILQGYISVSPGRTVRVRTWNDKGYLTIKGKTIGISRFEWEKEIEMDDVLELMKLCGSSLIDKTRYLVDFGGHTFEVDEFHGLNEGLVVAEIELSSEDEDFDKPDWLGDEVTGDSRFYNSMLMRNPYSQWPDKL